MLPTITLICFTTEIPGIVRNSMICDIIIYYRNTKNANYADTYFIAVHINNNSCHGKLLVRHDHRIL